MRELEIERLQHAMRGNMSLIVVLMVIIFVGFTMEITAVRACIICAVWGWGAGRYQGVAARIKHEKIEAMQAGK